MLQFVVIDQNKEFPISIFVLNQQINSEFELMEVNNELINYILYMWKHI